MLERAHALADTDPSAAYHLAVALHAGGGDAQRVKQLVQQALDSKEPFDEVADAKSFAETLN